MYSMVHRSFGSSYDEAPDEGLLEGDPHALVAEALEKGKACALCLKG